MQVAFRVDESPNIGIGHFMRCLTLANALSKHRAKSHFICRQPLSSRLRELARKSGHEIIELPNNCNESRLDFEKYPWLGVSQNRDAKETAEVLQGLNLDWIIVDHYGIDSAWERLLFSSCNKIMVIDDLADRSHHCNLLLDQTLTRSNKDYRKLVPSTCRLLLGAQYALLRPQFFELRSYSIERRTLPELKRVLISMGGTDPMNISGRLLEILGDKGLLNDLQVEVVLSSDAPCLDALGRQIEKMNQDIAMSIDVERMANVIAESDLVFGAAGTSVWERCCLGVPSLMVVLADNQSLIANALDAAGAAVNLGTPDNDRFESNVVRNFYLYKEACALKKMSENAVNVTTGSGASDVARTLVSLN